MSNICLEWEMDTLRNAALPTREGFIDGDWIETPYLSDEGIRLIQTGNVGRSRFIDKAHNKKYISQITFRILNCHPVHAGDLLICRLADPIGRACEVPVGIGDAITSVDCTIFKVNELVYDKRFVIHWLNSDFNLKSASDMAAGSTRSRISRTNLGGLPIPKPDIQEQSFIGKILDTFDIAIHKTEAIIEKLKQVKQGLLHDLLTRGVDANGELRPSYEQAPHLYQASPLGWIPKEWEVCNVGSVLQGIDAGHSPSCQDIPAKSDQWGVLKVGAVHPSGLKLLENKVIEHDCLKNAQYLVKNGDLLLSRANTPELVGLVAFVTNDPTNLMLSDKTLRLSVRANLIIARFLFWQLQHPKQRTQIEIAATGTSGSMKNISQSGVENIWIVRPLPREQQDIVARLDVVADRLEDESIKLSKSYEIKKGLMDDLLTGRVRVTDLMQEAKEAFHA